MPFTQIHNTILNILLHVLFPFFFPLCITYTHTHTPLLNHGELALYINNKNLLLYNNILFKIMEFNTDTSCSQSIFHIHVSQIAQ